jgi:hypothetical protein
MTEDMIAFREFKCSTNTMTLGTTLGHSNWLEIFSLQTKIITIKGFVIFLERAFTVRQSNAVAGR